MVPYMEPQIKKLADSELTRVKQSCVVPAYGPIRRIRSAPPLLLVDR